MKVAHAQTRVKSGGIESNLASMRGALSTVTDDVDVVLFTEMCASGYNVGCLFEYPEIIEEFETALHEFAQYVKKHCRPGLIIVVGGPRKAEPAFDDSGNIRLYNSAFVYRDGELLHVYDKHVLANDYHHEDRKYFVPGTGACVVGHGTGLAVLICEDVWHPDLVANVQEQLQASTQAGEVPVTDLLVLNFSYYAAGKSEKRKEVAQNVVEQCGVNVHYCNAVGVGDIAKNILVYDGTSFSLMRDGSYFEAARFASGLFVPENMNKTQKPSWEQETWQAMRASVKWCFEEFGLKKAQVHLSGGVDSSVVAALAVQALGPENVYFVTNPGAKTSETTFRLAQQVADVWGVPLDVVSMTGLESVLIEELGKTGKVTPLVKSTISAVGRTVVGLALTNQHYGEGDATGILATGNHTENILGWCNFHDIGSIGVMAPIGDLTKTELFQLCAWLNKEFGEVIPSELLDGRVKPMAELDDTTVDPFDYYLYSGVCAMMLRDRATPRQLIEMFDRRTLDVNAFPGDAIYSYDRDVFITACYDATSRASRSVYKSGQHAPVVVLSKRTRGFSARETLLNHHRWAKAAKPTARV
ncbi:MAG: NAD(+) synthase [Armatimonadetes bacterium]|nr:NAD(+) synthase [Armatimonadota bacterium]